MSNTRNQAHFECILPDERRKAREKKFRQSPEHPRPKLQEKMINSRKKKRQDMFKSTKLTKSQIKHEEETKSPAKVKDFIDHELLKDLNSKKSIRKTIPKYKKDWINQDMKLKRLNVNTAQSIITLLSHLHNIWNNKEIALIDSIVEIGYVVSGALFELFKELNTKEVLKMKTFKSKLIN